MSPEANDQQTERLSREAERDLIAKAQTGCAESSRHLVEAHKDRLFAFVWRMIRDHHDTEEICQDAFLRAFASLDSFSPQYRFSTWLFTIAYRLCLNSMRRKPMLSGEVDFSRMAGDEAAGDDVLARTEEAERMKETIWSAVDQLSPPQRAALLLFYREEQSCQDISGVMGMPVATVKSHLHRARTRLRTVLSETMSDHETVLRWLDARAG